MRNRNFRTEIGVFYLCNGEASKNYHTVKKQWEKFANDEGYDSTRDVFSIKEGRHFDDDIKRFSVGQQIDTKHIDVGENGDQESLACVICVTSDLYSHLGEMALKTEPGMGRPDLWYIPKSKLALSFSK